MRQHIRHIVSLARNRELFFLVLLLSLLALSLSWFSVSMHKPFASSEVQFTDTSRGGLAIVPASCASAGGCDDGDSKLFCTLTATPSTVPEGGQTLLTWDIQYTNNSDPFWRLYKVSIMPDNIPVTQRTGSVKVTPPPGKTTSYTLSGTGCYSRSACQPTDDLWPIGPCQTSVTAHAPTCTAPRKIIDGTCKCPGGGEYDAAKDVCVCPAGEQWDDTQKQCVSEQFSCQGASPAHANLCSGDASGLKKDWDRILVQSCSSTDTRKCRYKCDRDQNYIFKNNTCELCPSGQHPDAIGTACVCNASNALPVNGQCTACLNIPFCGDDNRAYWGDPDKKSCSRTLVTDCKEAVKICPTMQCVGSSTDLSITATPLVRSGERATVEWRAGSIERCSVEGTNNDGTGQNGNSTGIWECTGAACNASTTRATSKLFSQTIYTLSCDRNGETLLKSATVNIIPVFQER